METLHQAVRRGLSVFSGISAFLLYQCISSFCASRSPCTSAAMSYSVFSAQKLIRRALSTSAGFAPNNSSTPLLAPLEHAEPLET